jgi:hypothetical protein
MLAVSSGTAKALRTFRVWSAPRGNAFGAPVSLAVGPFATLAAGRSFRLIAGPRALSVAYADNHALVLDRGAPRGAPIAISPETTGAKVTSAKGVIDADGNATFAWIERIGLSRNAGYDLKVQARTLALESGTLGPVVTVYSEHIAPNWPGYDLVDPVEPGPRNLVLAANGRTTALTWVTATKNGQLVHAPKSGEDFFLGIALSRRTGGASFSSPEVVDGAGGEADVGSLALAAGPAGELVLLWSEYKRRLDGEEPFLSGSGFGQVRPAIGRPAAVRRLGPLDDLHLESAGSGYAIALETNVNVPARTTSIIRKPGATTFKRTVIRGVTNPRGIAVANSGRAIVAFRRVGRLRLATYRP